MKLPLLTLTLAAGLWSANGMPAVSAPNGETKPLLGTKQTSQKCPKCSAKVNIDWRFCDKCGHNLTIKLSDVTAPDTAKGILGAPELKAMLTTLGYELKTLNAEAGKEKYEFLITKSGFDVPIAAEISGSRNYIWLTVFLGPAPTADKAPASKFEALLKANYDVQPCQFYITSKGNLMVAVPMENRAMSSPIMKRNIDRLVDVVVDNAALWQESGSNDLPVLHGRK